MKVFITGGAGQVGSHVAEMLLAQGDTVVSIDNFETGRPEHLPEHKNFIHIEGSIVDKELITRLFEDNKFDAVVHTAASYNDPDDWHSDAMTNVVGGANLVKAAKDTNVGRFIYFQTALCYGTKPEQSPIELDHPIHPANSSYAITKTAAEQFLEYSGLDWVSFRLANVIGPRNVAGPLPIFYGRLKQGKKCFVTPARRDFVYVGDLAENVVKAVGGTGSGAYHFSSGTDIEIIELYDAVVKAMGINDYPEPDRMPLGDDDAPSILLDPQRTYADFGDIEFTPLEEFVKKAVDYYDEHGTLGEYTHLRIDKESQVQLTR